MRRLQTTNEALQTTNKALQSENDNLRKRNQQLLQQRCAVPQHQHLEIANRELATEATRWRRQCEQLMSAGHQQPQVWGFSGFSGAPMLTAALAPDFSFGRRPSVCLLWWAKCGVHPSPCPPSTCLNPALPWQKSDVTGAGAAAASAAARAGRHAADTGRGGSGQPAEPLLQPNAAAAGEQHSGNVAPLHYQKAPLPLTRFEVRSAHRQLHACNGGGAYAGNGCMACSCLLHSPSSTLGCPFLNSIICYFPGPAMAQALVFLQASSLPVPPNHQPVQLATTFEEFQRSLSPGGFDVFPLPGGFTPPPSLLSPLSAQTPIYAPHPPGGSGGSGGSGSAGTGGSPSHQHQLQQQQHPGGHTPSSQQLRMQQQPMQQLSGGSGRGGQPAYGAGNAAPQQRALSYGGLQQLQGRSPGLATSSELLHPPDRPDREQGGQVGLFCLSDLPSSMASLVPCMVWTALADSHMTCARHAC